MNFLKQILKSIFKFINYGKCNKGRDKKSLELKSHSQEIIEIREDLKSYEKRETNGEEKKEIVLSEGLTKIKNDLDYDIKRIGGYAKPHGGGTQDSLYLSKNIVAIADGVGESIGAEEASKFVTKEFVEIFKELEKVDFNSIMEIWTKLGESMKKKYSEYIKSKNIDFNRVLTGFLETTLLVVIELEDSYIITYLGNGSIWYVRGDFWEFLDNRRKWPWCIEDLLIPHTTYVGEEALYGILDSNGLRGSPSIMQIKKDLERGEIFILTTDGISSKDQLKVYGKNGESNYETPGRLEINDNIYNILLMLKDYFNNFENDSLSTKIVEFLESRKFDDDATLAILIGDKAVQYFKSKYNSKK